jgi:hypothetical protein
MQSSFNQSLYGIYGPILLDLEEQHHFFKFEELQKFIVNYNLNNNLELMLLIKNVAFGLKIIYMVLILF